MPSLPDILANGDDLRRKEVPDALLSLLQKGANYAAPNAFSLLTGADAPPLPNVPDTPGKVPSTQDPRMFGAVAEAANIGQNFIPQGGGAKLGGGMLAALIAPAARKGLAQKGIRAYHGSPHDFDRFDMSKIGTGEGAQAYGHGLYFADNPMVAKSYKEGLGRVIKVDNKPLLDKGRQVGTTGNNNADMALIATNGDLEDAISQYKSLIAKSEPSQSERGRYHETLKALEGLRGRISGGVEGKMYEVNIRARPEEFIDWDKRLIDQPQSVRNILSGGSDATVGNQFRQMFNTPEITQEMAQTGIPGIRYLDQGSRFQPQQTQHLTSQIAKLEAMEQTPDVARALAGRRDELAALQPTSNYVLFRDDIIDILRKYGLAGVPSTAALASALEQPQQ